MRHTRHIIHVFFLAVAHYDQLLMLGLENHDFLVVYMLIHCTNVITENLDDFSMVRMLIFNVHIFVKNH